jgi:hypothetical protein
MARQDTAPARPVENRLPVQAVAAQGSAQRSDPLTAATRPPHRQAVGYGPAVRIWTRILLASVLLTLAVAGCSHKNKTTKPDLSHSPSPSASTAPKAPAAASAHTRDGAIAFARYWWGALADYTYAQLDNAPLRATSSGECTACQSVIGSVASAKQQGEKYTGGQTTILDVEAPPVATDQPQVVDVVYNRAVQQRFDRGGKQLNSYPAVTQSTIELTLTWTDGHWVVTKVQRVGT